MTDPIPPDVRAEILAELDRIEAEHDVRVLFAVESGSRAWGFASPDSDFDVRFVYVHALDWYLSIDPRRDVIERPISDELDVSGWELRKALGLAIKPNPVLAEWLRSPVLYRRDDAAAAGIAEIAAAAERGRPPLHHYHRLAQRQYERFVRDEETVRLKKYFYVLRPAMALHWMRTRAGEPVPMDLAALRDGVALPPAVEDVLDDMLARKAVTREMGTTARIPSVDAYVEDELAHAQAAARDSRAEPGSLTDEANALFRRLVREAGPR